MPPTALHDASITAVAVASTLVMPEKGMLSDALCDRAHEAGLKLVTWVVDDAVRYVHSLSEAEESLAQRTARLALLMRPTSPRQIVDVSEARQSMPAKATFFHPKLPSGLVIHPLAV